MAFPTVQTADTKFGTQTSNSTSWTLTYPTNIAVGDLLVAFIASDGAGGFSLPAGWQAVASTNSGANMMYCFAKIATGSETGTFTGTGASEQGAWRIFRISAASWFGGSLNSGFDADGIRGSVTIIGSPSANPNPPSQDPSGWGTEDFLWIACCSVDTSRTISVYPLSDLQTADVSGGAGGATLGICMKNDAVSSLDPGTFTISTSDDWVAGTITVRPAAADNFGGIGGMQLALMGCGQM